MKTKTMKHIRRPIHGRVITGLLAGVGEYINVDPIFVRLFFVVATAFTGFGPGIVSYIIGSLIVPSEE
jgi:phage shock protein C